MNVFLQKTLAEHPEYGDFPDGAAVDVAGEQVLVLLRSLLYDSINLAKVCRPWENISTLWQSLYFAFTT